MKGVICQVLCEGYPLEGVMCRVSYVRCYVKGVICQMLYEGYHMLGVMCRVSYIGIILGCRMPRVMCRVSYVRCYMKGTLWKVLCVGCHMSGIMHRVWGVDVSCRALVIRYRVPSIVCHTSYVFIATRYVDR